MKYWKIIAVLGCIFVLGICITNTIKPIKTAFQGEVNHPRNINYSHLNKENGKSDAPDEYYKYQREIRIKEGEYMPGYAHGYKLKELSKAIHNKKKNPIGNANRKNTVNPQWEERGPGNVPGRTRGLLVDLSDPTQNTWFAGSAGGGIWKTTNGGANWINKTPDLPNLATTVLASSPADPKIIYAGTGEGFFNSDFITGDGIFKSTDGGETWNQLGSTAGNVQLQNINEIIVDPDDPNILLVCSNGFPPFKSGILKSTDGGGTWTNVHSASSRVQDLVFSPDDFNIQYATVNGAGIMKSIDAGNSWQNSSSGFTSQGRIELAISPVNPARIFAATQGLLTNSNGSSDLFISDDAGVSWSLLKEHNDGENKDWMSDLGWFANTIVAHPFNMNIVYLGGIDVHKVEVRPGSEMGPKQINSVSEVDTQSFLAFVSSTLSFLGGGFGTGIEWFEDWPGFPVSVLGTDFVSIEIRFGPGVKQMAHRFTVPPNAGTAGDGGAGIGPTEHMYQDYVEVPFEVWDIDNNRQLMVSFRDQEDDGFYELVVRSDADPTIGREYIFINAVDYDSITPDTNIAKDAGHAYKNIYTTWPTLVEGGVWDPDNLPESKIVVNYGELSIRFKQSKQLTTTGGVLSPGKMHNDQHKMIIMKTTGANFRILAANDGGVYYSNESTLPGENDQDWIKAGNTMNTGQFYGADKKRNVNEYIGGLQDNGTYKSFPNPTVNSSYTLEFGGDGFEVVWNYDNPEWIIGSSQRNRLRRTTNGGASWSDPINGLEDTGDDKAPFFTNLSNNPKRPYMLYTLGISGVWRSNNFGEDWTLMPITSSWVTGTSISSAYDVEISLANPSIVWAGGAMTTQRSIFVTQNGGRNFNAVNNYTEATMGSISGIATHPDNELQAYLLFSQAKTPKVLITKDLGQSWEDLSGFGSNEVSNNGFPDVAVHSLLVFPHDTNVIWVGTEIGIFESSDSGTSWKILGGDFPAVSVWSMKIVENQVVVATHGRGIWTATIDGLDWPGEIVTDIHDEFEVDRNKLSLYPNPAFDKVKARFDLLFTDKIVASLYDINGRMVKQLTFNQTQTHKREIEIDLVGLNPGLYIIEIDNGKEKISSRLLVK